MTVKEGQNTIFIISNIESLHYIVFRPIKLYYLRFADRKTRKNIKVNFRAVKGEFLNKQFLAVHKKKRHPFSLNLREFNIFSYVIALIAIRIKYKFNENTRT